MRSLFLILILLVACSSKTPKKEIAVAKPFDSTSIESKQLANEQESSFVKDIQFGKGKTDLSASHKKLISDLFKRARRSGKLEAAHVITWADQDYPSQKRESLSAAQEKLVDQRNKSISSYIENLDGELKIETVSMAQKPTTWQKLFSSEDARIKKSLEDAGIPRQGSPSEIPSKASKSIVIFLNH